MKLSELNHHPSSVEKDYCLRTKSYEYIIRVGDYWGFVEIEGDEQYDQKIADKIKQFFRACSMLQA